MSNPGFRIYDYLLGDKTVVEHVTTHKMHRLLKHQERILKN